MFGVLKKFQYIVYVRFKEISSTIKTITTMENSIFGITFNGVPTKIDTKFNEIYFEDDNAFFESKETFTHEEDGLTFNYKYAIEAVWCEGKIYYGLYLVPCADSLNKDKRSSVADCCGVNEDEITINDISSYGCNVCMGTEVVDNEDIEDTYLDKIASVYEVIDSLRGFYLDKYVNRIGNTGWDMLDDFINGNDFIKKIVA